MITEPVVEPESATSDTHIPTVVSAKETLTGIFRCSICFSTAPLPAASCSKCFAVIGCVPCIEQWIAITPTLAKCPLCRTSRHYNIIPMVRGLASVLEQNIADFEASNAHDTGSDADTIPYGRDDDDDDGREQLPQML